MNAPWEFDAIFPDSHDSNRLLHVEQQILDAHETVFAYRLFQETQALAA